MLIDYSGESSCCIGTCYVIIETIDIDCQTFDLFNVLLWEWILDRSCGIRWGWKICLSSIETFVRGDSSNVVLIRLMIQSMMNKSTLPKVAPKSSVRRPLDFDNFPISGITSSFVRVCFGNAFPCRSHGQNQVSWMEPIKCNDVRTSKSTSYVYLPNLLKLPTLRTTSEVCSCGQGRNLFPQCRSNVIRNISARHTYDH